ncbi:MAG: DUF4826 family protein [Erythrobacter sp.]
MDDDLDEETEEQWCAAQREGVLSYLVGQGFVSPNVGDWPAWHVAPMVAVWAVESQKQPGWVGWWAISGDLPTDYVTCAKDRSPRQAVYDIGRRWRDAAALWAHGKRCENMSLGSQDDEKELAPLLAIRAELLLDFASNDSIWTD